MDKTEARLARARLEIMQCPAYAAISALVLVMPMKVVEHFPTAAIDGFNMWFGKVFLDSLSHKQVNYVVAHEALHAFLQHCGQGRAGLYQTYDKQHQAMAVDYVVNLLVESDGCLGAVVERPVSPEPLVDMKYAGWSVLEVLKDLQKKGKTAPTLDEHLEPSSDGADGADGAGRVEVVVSEELRQEISNAIHAGIRRAQSITGNPKLHREVLDVLQKKARWQEYLENFVVLHSSHGDERDWRRPNRALLSTGFYLPAPSNESISEAVLAVDTSGSIGGEELREAIADMKALCASYHVDKLHIVYWDAGVASHEVFNGVEDAQAIDVTQPKGGGGTDFAPVLSYLHEQGICPNFVVGWTDGYVCNWGQAPQFPVMWVMSSDVTPPYGQVISLGVTSWFSQ